MGVEKMRKYKLTRSELNLLAKRCYQQGKEDVHEKSFNKWLFLEMSKMEWEIE